MYVLIVHWLQLLRKYTRFVVLPSVFYSVDVNAWHLGKMVDLDIMVARNFLPLMKVFNWLSITQS